MKKIPLLLVFISMAALCHAQIEWGRYSQTFSGTGDKGPRLIAAIPRENNAFWALNAPSVLRNAFAEKKDFLAGRPEDFIAITTFDQEPAHFFVKDAGQGNSLYEFRVLKDGKEIVADWTTITQPASESVKSTSTISDLMYVGAYKADVGHYLVVDVRRKNDTRILSTAVVAWRPIRPMLFNIYTANELNDFLQRLSHPHGYYMTEAERKKWRTLYGAGNLDPVTSLPKKMVVEPTDNSLIFMLKADIREKEQLQYELVKDNNILRAWGGNEFDNNFIWLKDVAPGDYVLRIRYAAQPDNILEYTFKVKAPPGLSVAYLVGISSLIAAFLALVIIVPLYLRQKRQMKRESSHREKLELEMKGIRSQLNPHFVFNSLNSIQGLVNTGRIRESNDYIALFAKLMRTTLALGETNQGPLQQEIDYIDNYLRLEQLRFNFAYDIHIDPSLRTGEIDFPTLLLQPLVENAVKHGMNKNGNGKIDLHFERSNSDLVVTVRDNGKGFEEKAQSQGYGLHLTRQRIKLLNDAAGRRQVTMNIASDKNGETVIQLLFKEWLNEIADNSD